MESEAFDLIWIGTGQATMTVVPRLLAAGRQVAVIEAEKVGGTCLNAGCTPTKTLVASARAIHQARRGEEFGFAGSDPVVDFARVMAQQQEPRAQTSRRLENYLARQPGCTLFKGHGEFVDANHVRVGDKLLHARHIVIHTGTRPVSPSLPGIEQIDWLDNQRLLDLTTLPEHLAIVGGSYIALEFAQIFRRFGAKVSVLERSGRLMPREDEDVARVADQILRAEGIDIHYDTQVRSLAADGGVRLSLEREGEVGELHASHILFAIGRIPNSDGLQLDKAGVERNERGNISVNARLQTSQLHIFAIGDVNGRGAFTHTSVHDGEVFWDHYSRELGINPEPSNLDRSADDRTLVYAMFLDPPLARVGMSEAQARASGREVLIATYPMERIARAREKRETQGLVKVLVDARDETLLGATVFGTGGDEVIGMFALLIRLGGSWKQLRRTVLPHPTVSELMPWVFDELRPLT